MGSIFRNPIVLAQNVIGSLIDVRNVILWRQPSGNIDDLIESPLTENTRLLESIRETAKDLVGKTQLEELFTGLTIPLLSDINGFNMFGVSYLSADVNIYSDLCKHPVETGEVIIDNAVLQPVKATVRVVMPTALYTRIYNQMLSLYTNKNFIILQTKFGFYKNMVLVKMPYKLEVSNVDRPIIEMELEQVFEAYPEYISSGDVKIPDRSVVNGEDSDTQNIGRQVATTLVDVLEEKGRL